MIFDQAQMMELLIQYKYVIIFPIAIIEGPILTFVCGTLFKLGYFDFWPLYLVLIFGDLAGDFAWYYLGYWTAKPLVKQFGIFLNITPAIFEKLELLFHGHKNKILFLNKISMGFGFTTATLMAAGASRVSIRSYALMNLLGGFIWTGFLMTLGYYFGYLYSTLEKELGLMTLIFAGVVLIFVLNGFRKYWQQRFLQNKI